MQTIVVEKKTVAKNDLNESIATWHHFLKAAVLVRMVSPKTVVADNKKSEISSLLFSIKPTPKVKQITTDDRIIYQDKNYVIFGIDGIGKDGYINIRAES